MPEPEETNPPAASRAEPLAVSCAEPYWQKIMESTFADSLWKPFKPRLCYFLKMFVLEVNALNKPGHPEEIGELRFKEMCQRFQSQARYIDHLALNLGCNRIENVARLAFRDGFKPVDYFMPTNEKAVLISLVMLNQKTDLCLMLNEGIDGWTVKTANRALEFQRFLKNIFKDTSLPIPEIKYRTDLKTRQKYIMLITPENKEPQVVIPDDAKFADSPVSVSVKKRGEFLSHIALDTERIITPSLPTGIYQPRTMDELFEMINTKDILPLSSKNILTGTAGRAPYHRHEIKRFFTKELAHGLFLEFIERLGAGAKRGFYPPQECLIN